MVSNQHRAFTAFNRVSLWFVVLVLLVPVCACDKKKAASTSPIEKDPPPTNSVAGTIDSPSKPSPEETDETSTDETPPDPNALFHRLSESQTGITFRNAIVGK